MKVREAAALAPNLRTALRDRLLVSIITTEFLRLHPLQRAVVTPTSLRDCDLRYGKKKALPMDNFVFNHTVYEGENTSRAKITSILWNQKRLRTQAFTLQSITSVHAGPVVPPL